MICIDNTVYQKGFCENFVTCPRLRFNVLSIDFMHITNCFYDYYYDICTVLCFVLASFMSWVFVYHEGDKQNLCLSVSVSSAMLCYVTLLSVLS